MDQDLRSLFDRALSDEPPSAPNNLAQEAMASGTRLRRRRGLVLGGSAAAVVAVFATVIGLNVAAPAEDTAPLVNTRAAMLADPGCEAADQPTATDVSIFLTADIADQQRRDLDAALRSDPSVRSVRFESREQALVRFKEMYADAPELVASVTADNMPESFRVRLVNPSQYAALKARVEKMGGVDDIFGLDCPEGSSSKGGQ